MQKVREKQMGIDLPVHAVHGQSLKFLPFVDPEKSHWQKSLSQRASELTQFLQHNLSYAEEWDNP